MRDEEAEQMIGKFGETTICSRRFIIRLVTRHKFKNEVDRDATKMAV